LGERITPEASEIGARFDAAHRRLRTAAVTGTNGKTTTTSMIEAVVVAAGEPSARLTTIGAWLCGEPVEAADPGAQFLALVEGAVAKRVRTLALEVTSKALGTGLAKRWPPSVAVFTNLTRDHLDMHGSPEAYLAAKAQLFMALRPGGCAVLNADDGSSALIREVIPPGVSVRGFSVCQPRVSLAASRVIAGPRGTTLELVASPLADALGGCLALAVVGAVHAQNALAAALACDALGYPGDVIKHGLEEFGGAPGRFQIVGRDPLVAVDYAHTPDGLDGTLKTAREIVETAGRGRVICVFGCGGMRDRGKRPQMGAIADRLSDVVVLTTDNPRNEEPAAIADAVRAGAPSPRAAWHVELDRAAAIAWAIAQATADDLVVIAGKGHEEEQEVHGVKTPFSDAAVAREALARRAVR
jgi:UDP-N-acetylmuramoyl-L-alanyl-D-glutamate--2,6-diaminopimelate ligase